MVVSKPIIIGIIIVIIILIGGAAIKRLLTVYNEDTVFQERRTLSPEATTVFTMPLKATAPTHRFYLAVFHTNAGQYDYTLAVHLETPSGDIQTTTMIDEQAHNEDVNSPRTHQQRLFSIPSQTGPHSVSVSISSMNGSVDITAIELRVTTSNSQ